MDRPPPSSPNASKYGPVSLEPAVASETSPLYSDEEKRRLIRRNTKNSKPISEAQVHKNLERAKIRLGKNIETITEGLKRLEGEKKERRSIENKTSKKFTSLLKLINKGYLNGTEQASAINLVYEIQNTLKDVVQTSSKKQLAEIESKHDLMKVSGLAYADVSPPKKAEAVKTSRMDEPNPGEYDLASGPQKKALEGKPKKSKSKRRSPPKIDAIFANSLAGDIVTSNSSTFSPEEAAHSPETQEDAREDESQASSGSDSSVASDERTAGIPVAAGDDRDAESFEDEGSESGESGTRGSLRSPSSESLTASEHSDGMPYFDDPSQHADGEEEDDTPTRAPEATSSHAAGFRPLPRWQVELPGEDGKVDLDQEIIFPESPYFLEQRADSFPSTEEAPFSSHPDDEGSVDLDVPDDVEAPDSSHSEHTGTDRSPRTVLEPNGDEHDVQKEDSDVSLGVDGQPSDTRETVWNEDAGLRTARSAYDFGNWRTLSASLARDHEQTQQRELAVGIDGADGGCFLQDIVASFDSPRSSDRRNTVAGRVLPVHFTLRSAFWRFCFDQILAWYHLFWFSIAFNYALLYSAFGFFFKPIQDLFLRFDWNLEHPLRMPMIPRIPAKSGLIIATHMMLLGSLVNFWSAIRLHRVRYVWVAANGLTRIALIDYLRGDWLWGWLGEGVQLEL